MTNPDTNPGRAETLLSRRSRWLGWGIVAMAFVLAAALTWRKWPDLLIDYGTQLYIPWRLLHGTVLYRDIFYFGGGPLAQYFNALLFKFFGVSFSTLIIANVLFTGAMVWLIFRRFLAAADVWTATLIGLAIDLVFAFAQFTPIGNYNYITPYSYEATYGLMLSVLAIALLADWINAGKIRFVFAGGFCAGLVLLTKPDIFMALAMGSAAAFVLFYLKYGGRMILKSLAAFLVADVLPPLFFFLYFLRLGGGGESLRLTFFGWVPLLQGTVTKSPFYLWCLGLDHPLINVTEILVYFVAIASIIILSAAVLRWAKRFEETKFKHAALLVLILALSLCAIRFNWIECGWPLPLLCLATCLFIGWNYQQLGQPVFPLLWSVFGLALLAKLGLFPRIWHYGFVLAMPAAVASIYLLFWLLPEWLEKKYAVPAKSLRLLVAIFLVIGFTSLFEGSQGLYAQKNLPLGTGGDRMIAENLHSEQSQAIYAALAWTDKYMPTNATLVVLPEGVMLNYLTRHVNPMGGLDWNPTMFTVFGQETMTDRFEKNPPDYVFIVEWDSSEFGVGYFGSSPEYGQALMQFIRQHYRGQVLIGHEPLKDRQFGIEILKREVSK